MKTYYIMILILTSKMNKVIFFITGSRSVFRIKENLKGMLRL